jgi:hypothetical protein
MAATGNSCFWLADFFKSSPLKLLGQMNQNLVGSFYGMSSMKIAHFVAIRWQTWPPQAILVSDWPIFKNLLLWNRLAKWTETYRPRNPPIRNKNCMWWPCLLTNRDEMSNLYRGPPIDASYQDLVHLDKRFQRRRFFKISYPKQELTV